MGRRQGGYAKVTSRRRRCGGPPSDVARLEIAVNDQVGGSWSGSGDQQNTNREKNVAVDLSGVSGFIVLPFLFPAELVFFAVADPEEAKNLAGGILRLIEALSHRKHL